MSENLYSPVWNGIGQPGGMVPIPGDVKKFRCPDCGELVPTIFEHVDGCPSDEEPAKRPTPITDGIFPNHRPGTYITALAHAKRLERQLAEALEQRDAVMVKMANLRDVLTDLGESLKARPGSLWAKKILEKALTLIESP